MKEQDFIPKRASFRDRLILIPGELRGVAAAAASAAGLAAFAFVLAVLPPVPGSGVMVAVAEGLNAAALA